MLVEAAATRGVRTLLGLGYHPGRHTRTDGPTITTAAIHLALDVLHYTGTDA
ncbi:hypothetical protein ABT095_11315 [Kitasatospora sp. NPDC002227]|uniref:hypothetical protein n=1 Tax=Kitasatospora sp. NPDC002227 TaxID=3154773 RepID=UPI00332A7A37